MVLLSYQLVVLLSLLIFTGIAIWNLFELRLLPGPDDEEETGALPFVSVLVPARNEEHAIEACVSSLLQQRYPRYEVIVLDDGSEDATHAILLRLGALAGPRLRVVKGEPLPSGWHGKAWACQQLGDLASGELLLFTDADTRHMPDTLFRSVTALRDAGADMLTLTPYQEMRGFVEKLVVPLVYFILMCYLPLRLVWKSRYPAFCVAIGQFMLFSRDSYRRIGAHGSVRDCLVEDICLCRQIKSRGGRVMVFDGTDAVSCRMYRSPAEVIGGFSKNLFAGLGYRASGLFVLVLLTLAFHVIPWVVLAVSLFRGWFSLLFFWLPLLQVLVPLVSRILIALRFRQPLLMAALHALSQLALVAIALNSFFISRFGRGAAWKGRSYHFSPRARIREGNNFF